MVMSATESVGRTLVGAAGAAARGGVGGRLALLHLERMPAAAGGGDVRIIDLEAGLLQAVQEVDRRALQVRRAVGVDDDIDTVQLELVVALLRAAVESERVLEAGATAALDGDAQNRDLLLLGHELLDLVRSRLGEGDQGVGALDRCHVSMVATRPARAQRAAASFVRRLCNTR